MKRTARVPVRLRPPARTGTWPAPGPDPTPPPHPPDYALDADLRRLVGELGTLLHAVSCTLFLWDAPQQMLTARYRYAAHDGQVVTLVPEPACVPRLWSRLGATLQPLLITDPQHDPLVADQERMSELGIITLLAAPLVVNQRAIGLLTLGRTAAAPVFDETALSVAGSFAAQVALTIENARLHQQAVKQAEQLALVNEVGWRIHAILDPERLLAELVALITASFHYYCTAVCLVDGPLLVVRAAHSAARGRAPRLIGVTLPLDGPGLAPLAIRSNETLLVDDVRTHPAYRPMPGWPDVGSALVVPLPAWDGLRGALVLAAREQRAFDAGDKTLMEALAGQITVALANAGLYRQAADRAGALAAANVRLAELDQLKSDFLSLVSHELRTPLGVIKGYVGTLLQAPALDPATEREFLAGIDAETDALSELVSNLLDMSQIEAGRLRMQPTPTDLGALVAGAGASLRARVPHPVQLAVDPDLPLALVDGRRITQVLANLLENAARAAPPTTPIAVAVGRTTDGLQVSVRDQGPGIAPADLPSIFDKFYRGAVGAGGSGLGLAIARSIIQAHGGRLWVESGPGGGAVFLFVVPVAPGGSP